MFDIGTGKKTEKWKLIHAAGTMKHEDTLSLLKLGHIETGNVNVLVICEEPRAIWTKPRRKTGTL